MLWEMSGVYMHCFSIWGKHQKHISNYNNFLKSNNPTPLAHTAFKNVFDGSCPGLLANAARLRNKCSRDPLRLSNLGKWPPICFELSSAWSEGVFLVYIFIAIPMCFILFYVPLVDCLIFLHILQSNYSISGMGCWRGLSVFNNSRFIASQQMSPRVLG